MEDLELTHVADTRIGDESLRGLSGGQKRRVTVAVELVTEPSTAPRITLRKHARVCRMRLTHTRGPAGRRLTFQGLIFLDEPTSGLVRRRALPRCSYAGRAIGAYGRPDDGRCPHRGAAADDGRMRTTR